VSAVPEPKIAPREDPLAPWKMTWRSLFGFALVAVSLFVYPWLIDAVLERYGARPVAALALLLTLVGGVGSLSRGGRLEIPSVPGLPAGLALLPAATLLTGDLRFLFLVPAGVYLWLALMAGQSLREEISLIERFARILQPRAPEFIRPYCRKVTALWGLVFLGAAIVIVYLVSIGAVAERRAFTAYGLWLPVGILSAVEYAVRKAWFRYYAGGVLDAIWAALLPAENTERGRRSLAYIREARARMRAEGFTPPGEAARR
jgi:uncharacterized membrane protein